jgi:hypothetical protein
MRRQCSLVLDDLHGECDECVKRGITCTKSIKKPRLKQPKNKRIQSTLLNLAINTNLKTLRSTPPSDLPAAFGMEGLLGPNWMLVAIGAQGEEEMTKERFMRESEIVSGEAEEGFPMRPADMLGKKLGEVGHKVPVSFVVYIFLFCFILDG